MGTHTADLVGRHTHLDGSFTSLVGTQTDLVSKRTDLVGILTSLVGTHTDLVGNHAELIGRQFPFFGGEAKYNCPLVHTNRRVYTTLRQCPVLAGSPSPDLTVLWCKVLGHENISQCQMPG